MKQCANCTSRNRRLDALVGFILGMGAPLGWLALRFLKLHHDPLFEWLRTEIGGSSEIYAYLTVATVTIFTFFGYLLGRRSDLVVGEKDSIRHALDEVHHQAMTDALTGLNNARHLHEALSMEIESAKRYDTPLTCFMIDIDNFKGINDSHGHPFGDKVLMTLAKILRQNVRRIDTLGRLGGEEFLVIMPHTAKETAYTVGERVRRTVENWPFSIDGKKIGLTVSIGVAAFPSQGAADKMGFLKSVDEALYLAKHAGKNKTVLSHSPN